MGWGLSKYGHVLAKYVCHLLPNNGMHTKVSLGFYIVHVPLLDNHRSKGKALDCTHRKVQRNWAHVLIVLFGMSKSNTPGILHATLGHYWNPYVQMDKLGLCDDLDALCDDNNANRATWYGMLWFAHDVQEL